MGVGAAICFVVALGLELVGIGLVVREGRHAQQALGRYLDLNPRGNPGGSWGQVGELQPVIVAALGNQAKRGWAIGLLVSGVLAGSAGNFLALQAGG